MTREMDLRAPFPATAWQINYKYTDFPCHCYPSFFFFFSLSFLRSEFLTGNVTVAQGSRAPPPLALYGSLRARQLIGNNSGERFCAARHSKLDRYE